MANVKSVRDKGDKAAILVLEDGVEVWTPDREKARELLGKPIPSDWTMREGDYGPQALPPREKKGGGGATAWRNTKEGFEAEQNGRLRWQQVEEERRDRRTALMQAVTAYGQETATQILARADDFYAWLRKSDTTAGRGVSDGGVGVTGASDPSASSEVRALGKGLASDGSEPGGGSLRGDSPSPGKGYPNAVNDGHNHEFNTPDGRCHLCGKPG